MLRTAALVITIFVGFIIGNMLVTSVDYDECEQHASHDTCVVTLR